MCIVDACLPACLLAHTNDQSMPFHRKGCRNERTRSGQVVGQVRMRFNTIENSRISMEHPPQASITLRPDKQVPAVTARHHIFIVHSQKINPFHSVQIAMT
jgi:hypothetical protein